MNKCRLSQEELKIIACVTMLLDHIGAVLIPMMELRLIGRLSFPIYCFLLAEGVSHTRSKKAYGLRLLVVLLLSEVPFDLLFFGKLTFAHQSVMVTLLLGFLFAVTAGSTERRSVKALLLLPFMMLAEVLNADYGCWGVAMIGLFVITRELSGKIWVQALGLAGICWMIGGMTIIIGSVTLPIQMFSMMAMIPVVLYDGSKRTDHIWVRHGFYLFYPVHLLLLLLAAGV